MNQTNQLNQAFKNKVTKLKQIQQSPKNVTRVYFDGGLEGRHPSKITSSVVIEIPGMPLISLPMRHGVPGTSNEAEWVGAFRALHECHQRGIKDFVVMGDSQMVINVINGVYKQHKPHLKALFESFQQMFLEMNINSCKFEWIPRDKNVSGWTIAHTQEETGKFDSYVRKERQLIP
jgi:ribonuclease HI